MAASTVSRYLSVAGALAMATMANAQTDVRPMSTDRPDRTESPYSVPAEHFQLELDFVSFGHFENDNITIDGYSLLPCNVKYGFTDNVDVQLLFTPYLSTTTTTNGIEESDDGTGLAGLRFKINLAGNDGGGNAVAILPYVFTPTRGENKSDNAVYGFIVPVAFPFANGRAAGVMAGVEQLGEESTFGFASATFSAPLANGWSGFLEGYGIADGFDDEDDQIVTLDAGVVFAPRDNLTLDAGIYYGLTSDAENWRVFAGLSARK